MSPKRIFYGMLAFVILLVGFCVFGTYFAQKKLISKGNALHDLKLEQAVLSKQETALVQAKKDIAEYEELEKIAKAIVPQEKDQARTVLELVNIARETGISIVSVQFPESQLGQITKKGATTKQTGDNNTTQLTPVTDLKGVYTMEINIQTDTENPVRYQQLLDYLARLEKNRRTALVTNISIQPAEGNRGLVTFSLVLNSYVKP